jgi:hypothetical protein
MVSITFWITFINELIERPMVWLISIVPNSHSDPVSPDLRCGRLNPLTSPNYLKLYLK